MAMLASSFVISLLGSAQFIKLNAGASFSIINGYGRAHFANFSSMAHIEEIRNKIHLDLHTVRNTEDTRYPGTYSGYDDSWNLAKFKKDFKLEIVSRSAREVEFDMIGIDTPFANAFRRILLAEVPTMAVEQVFIYNNTSVMQDEVLAHRLGLLPINVDPR